MDTRLRTFLVLCRTMNYRKTAEIVHLTQPAVTRQIHSLENEYNAKLFLYDGRSLVKTDAGALLEGYAASLQYNYENVKAALAECSTVNLRVGATKTIGDYAICDLASDYLKDHKNNLTLFVDNTEHLLQMLNENELDFAIVEGFFDKSRYGYHLFKTEEFTGICSRSHSFAGRHVAPEELFAENLIIREIGSGTRSVFERELGALGYTVDSFKKLICISSFTLIKELLLKGAGITFAYRAIISDSDEFETFSIKDEPIYHEFNFVYLKDTDARRKADIFCGLSSG